MKQSWIAIVLLGSLAVGNVHAFDWFGGRLSLGGGYGLSKPRQPGSFHASHREGPMWTANAKYFVNDRWSVVASYADLRVKDRDQDTDIHFRPVVGSVRFNVFRGLPITPYVTAGAGAAFNKRESAPNVFNRFNKPTMQGGLGLEFFINQQTSIGAEGLYHNFIGDNHGKPYGVISAVATLNMYFGDGPSTRQAKLRATRESQRADAATQRADDSQRQASSAQQQALSAQQQTLTAQQQTELAQQQALAAEQAAAAANAARAEADRLASDSQAQLAQAQSEVDALKQMIARRDLKPVNFRSASANLLPESNEALAKIADVAKKYPNLKLRVEGHTDSQGADEYNQTLSQQRADSVREALITSGVPSQQVVSVGFGETRPIASNESAQGRAENRRVEFIFFLK